MTELLTAAQMRAIEQAAIDGDEVTGLELMERAGQGVVDAIFAEWPELATPKPSAPAAGGAGGSTPPPLRASPPEYLRQNDRGVFRAVVLCGPGNNGGDGFVVARLLKEAGWEVGVFLYGDPDRLPPDAKVNYARWITIGAVEALSERAFRKAPIAQLYVDALFGTGLARPAEGELAAFLRYLGGYGGDDYRSRMVAVDVPSGLCADSGRVVTEHSRASFPTAVLAQLTVTFDSPKSGHFLQDGPYHCGRVVVQDIGLQWFREHQLNPHTKRSHIVRFPRTTIALENRMIPDSRPFFGVDPRYLAKKQGHKYAHGHALILSGGVGKGGAARLAARGALRVGAGAVSIGTHPSALIENAAQLNAIMLGAIKDAGILSEILRDARINTLCIGPGLGLGEREAKMLSVALDNTRPGPDPGPQPVAQAGSPGSSPGRRLVLDADALTLLAQDKTLFAKLHKNCILTPHAGEFARLFPDIAAKLDAPATKGPAYSKVDATRDAAKRAGCIVLFKGADTVIADPSGRCSINASLYERSAPWLATAGSGDVLAGFITGLLARGYAPMQAAETGAWLHTECALSFGPGLIAEDLPEELPKVFRALGL